MTDMTKLREIEKRWADRSNWREAWYMSVEDIAWLIGEVKRLRRELALYLEDEDD